MQNFDMLLFFHNNVYFLGDFVEKCSVMMRANVKKDIV